MADPDVTVVGLGPAGRILAHRLARAGASVAAIDPHPDRRWFQSFGGWQHQLPTWFDGGAIGSVANTVVLRTATQRPEAESRPEPRSRTGVNMRPQATMAGREHRVAGRYVMLDTAAFQDSLTLDGVRVHAERVDGDLDRAGIVVDCRGTTPLGFGRQRGTHASRRRLPQQTAFGCRVSAEVAAPMLQGADAVLMDWRPYHGGSSWGRERASFCYLVPLADGSVLIEETCLAGDPALSTGELRRRLGVRAAGFGIASAELSGQLPEFVQIAVLRRPRPGIGFGAAGPQLNPISGYSVFASLQQVDALVSSLLSGRLPADTSARALRRTALGALLHLSGDATMALFDAFGRLDPTAQRAVLQPDASARALVGAFWSQWAAMPLAGKLGLIGATVRGVVNPPVGV